MSSSSILSATEILSEGARVLRLEGDALLSFSTHLDESFVKACEIIYYVKGRVITSGMGKSGHIARKIAATLASTGTPSNYVHPGEASHGDLGMVMHGDVCLVLSNSGETSELSDLIAHTRRFDIPLIGVASKPQSTLLKAADVALVLPNAPEACAIGMAPTTSTTLTLALGDALCVAVMKMRGFLPDQFRTFHPGGKLGAQLMRVQSLMHAQDHTQDALPLVSPDTPMAEVLLTMTHKSFGVVGIVDNHKLIGIITDGDLRRHMVDVMQKTAQDVMSYAPRTISKDALAAEALALMNAKKITVLFVVDKNDCPIGLIHLHDCLRAGIL
jgi:arabinose-5-phosphate isomerase